MPGHPSRCSWSGPGGRWRGRSDASWAARPMPAVLGPCVSVDIPSGVDGLTGTAPGDAVRASHTVCFAALKPGVVFEPGASHAGEVTVVDIGIDLGFDP